jgi:23S rRNA (uracil747-C5)-methyltransferase
MRLTGIEIAPEAIACAKQSAAELGLTNLHFQALDSTQFATAEARFPTWCWSTRRAADRPRAVRLFAVWRRPLLSTPAATRDDGERYRSAAGLSR